MPERSNFVQGAPAMRISTYTGGILDTNAFLLETEAGSTLFDAPDGVSEWLREKGKKVDLLLLTHGHIDHTLDAARVKREHGCSVAYHADGRPMLTDPAFFRDFGFNLEVEPCEADRFVDEGPGQAFGPCTLDLFLVPGHCPGSLCFLDKEAGVLYGGDVLFAGGVGRWDLPGGDRDLLFAGIREKLFPLGDEIKVLPGHGPATTIGHERTTNPFLL